MRYDINFEQETDGRWIAEIRALPGVMVCGSTRTEAQSKVEALALRVIADKLEREHATTEPFNSQWLEFLAEFERQEGPESFGARWMGR